MTDTKKDALANTNPPAGHQVAQVFNLTPKSLTEAMKYAELMAKSEVVPKDYIGKPQNILVAVQMGMELGLSPLNSINSIAVINGRPTMWGDAVLAVIVDAEVLEESFGHGGILELEPEEALKKGYGQCQVLRKGWKEPLVRKFTLEMAEKANLIKRGGDMAPWTTYRGRMLQMRARSWALRDSCPDVLKGLKIREEEQDVIVDAQFSEVKDVVIPALPRKASDVTEEEKDFDTAAAAPTNPEFPNPFVCRLKNIAAFEKGKKKYFIFYAEDGTEFRSKKKDLVDHAKDLGKGSEVDVFWEREGETLTITGIDPHDETKEPDDLFSEGS